VSHLRFAAPLAALLSAAPAFAGTVAFDDATTNSSATITTYTGLTWTNVTVYRDDAFSNIGFQSGLDYGVLSPRYAAANTTEGYAIIQSAAPFDFFGGNFTSFGKNNATLTILGYLPTDTVGAANSPGTPTYTYATTFSATAPTNIPLNFTGVTAIKILAFHDGSTVNAFPSQPTFGDFFLLDNFSYSGPSSAPEPASLAVFGIGTLALIRRRRGK
jgi:hypothetical protein